MLNYVPILSPRLVIFGTFALISLLGAGQVTAQTEFELSTPDSNVRSIAIKDGDRLTVTNNGQSFVYERERQIDEEGFTGFMNRELGQALLWPTSDQGRLRVGTFNGEGIRFRNSEMVIRPVPVNLGGKAVATDPITIDFRDAPVPRDEGVVNVFVRPTRVLFSPDGSELIIAAFVSPQGISRSAPSDTPGLENRSAVDAIILFWDIRNKRWGESIPGSSDVAIADDGTLAHITSAGEVVLGDPRNGSDSTLNTETNEWGSVENIQFLRMEGRLILLTAGQNRVAYWNVADQSLLSAIKLDGSQVVEWVPGSEAVALGRPWVNGGRMEQGDGIRVIDPDSEGGTEEARLVGHEFVVTALAIDPVDEIIASADYGDPESGTPPTLIIWSEVTKKIIGGLDHSIQDIAFSPDGKTLATAGVELSSRAGLISLWDILAGAEKTRLLRSLVGHQQLVTSVAFSPDGKSLASVSLDQTLKIWPLQAETQPIISEVALTVKDEVSQDKLLGAVEFSIAQRNLIDDGRSYVLGRVDASPTSTVPGIYKYELAPGTYEVTASRQDYESTTEIVDVGNVQLEQTILLKPMVVAYPVVLDVKDEDSNPVSDAKITISGITAEPIIDDEGSYRYQLKDGTYDVAVSKDGFTTNSTSVTVRGSGFNKTIALKLKPRPTYAIELTVRDDKGALIRAATLAIKGVTSQPKANENGTYEYRLQSGTYELTVNKEGFQPASKTLFLDAQAIRETIDLVPVPPTAFPLFINLTDANSVSINDATITIPGITDPPKANGEGGYEYLIKPGTYEVTVEKEGFTAVTRSIVVGESAARETISLLAKVVPEKGTFEFLLNIVDQENKPLTGLDIVVGRSVQVSNKGIDGNYAFYLPPGIYDFEIELDGLSFNPGRFAIDASDVTLQSIPVPKEDFEEMQLKALLGQLDFNLDNWVDEKDFPGGGWEQFKALDKNDSSELDWKELRPLLAADEAGNANSGTPNEGTEQPAVETDPKKRAAQLKVRLDFNHDGRLDKDDFPETGWEQIKQTLGKEDAVELGEEDLMPLVKIEEALATADEQPEQLPEMTEDELVDKLFLRMDFDLNGVIDKDDFSELSWADLKGMDSDGSGTLSKNELRTLTQAEVDETAEDDETTGGPIQRISGNGSVRGTLTIRKSGK